MDGAQAADLTAVARRLEESARHHKQEANHHREAARRDQQALETLLGFCRTAGIPITREAQSGRDTAA